VTEDPADPADRLAVRRHVPLAVRAAAALRDGRHQHPVTGLESGDRVADFGDRADRLVAENAAVGHRRDISLENMQVGATDRRGIHPHDHVGRLLDRGIGDLFPGLLPRSVVHQRLHRHLRAVMHVVCREPNVLKLIITALGTDAPNAVGLVYIAAFGQRRRRRHRRDVHELDFSVL